MNISSYMMNFLHQSICAQNLHIFRISLPSPAKQFAEHMEIRVDLSRLSEEVLPNMQWCAMGIINPEPIEGPSESLDILFHSSPKEPRIIFIGSIAQLNKILPNHNAPSQIMEVFRIRKVLLRIGIKNPSIVGCQISIR